MDRKIFLPEIIKKFKEWYLNDPHSKNINYYDDKINFKTISNLNNDELIDFFYKFIEDGGKVQSGGDRAKNRFKEFITPQIDSFKKFILEPFDSQFNLETWFNSLDTFKHFGIGIATIYLNRINNDKYSILNNKTIKALNELGYELSLNKSFTNYKNINKIQLELILQFPSLNNLYKTDALNHFVIGTNEGRQLLLNYVYKEIIEDNFEQDEILDDIKDIEAYDDKDKLLKIIQRNENDKHDTITIKTKSYKRSNFLMTLIKKYRNYECQFCRTKIEKENGDFYIEACHIEAKAKGGKDKMNNILILCPNCHKLFDYGKRTNEVKTNVHYSVDINGKKYEADLM